MPQDTLPYMHMLSTHIYMNKTCTPTNTHPAGLQVSHGKLLAVQKQLKTWLLLSSMMDGVEVC